MYFIILFLHGSCIAQAGLKLLNLPTACHLLHAGITGVHYVALGMELRALCMIGKCFTNSVLPLALCFNIRIYI